MARRILITGGTAGIGFELVKRLVRRHELIVVGRTGNEDLEKLNELTDNLIWVQTDLSKPEEAAKAIDKAMKDHDWRHLNNAILNAGTGFVVDPTMEDAEKLRQTLDVNLAANIVLAEKLYTRLAACKGKISFIGSVAHKGKANFASYAATKAGLHGFARALRQEWAGRVKVQILHIGPTNTDMHEKAGLKLGKMRELFATPQSMAGMIEKGVASHHFTLKLSFLRDWTGSSYFTRGLR